MVLPPKPTGLDLSVDQMYDWYRVNFPNDPAILYLDENDSKKTITWEAFWKAIMKGSEIIYREFPELRNGNAEDKPMVLAILATTDNPTYVAFLYAHFRLTHPQSGRSVLPFLISTRNSPLGIADLIKNTQTEAIWVSEGPMRNLAKEALETNSELKTRILAMPSFNDLYHPQEEANVSAQYDARPVLADTPLVTLHSSGSTSFPKSRVLRHIVAKEWAIDNERREISLQGEIVAVSPPTYHGMGLISTAYLGGSRVVLALNSPHGSHGPISSDEFLKLVMVTGAKYMITIPNFLEDWCENPEAVAYLQSMKGLVWGGGPISGDAGKRLFDLGVPMYLMYGTTETGIINKTISEPIKEGYEWFSFGSHVHIHLAPMDEPDVFQVIVGENDAHHLNVYNTELNGVPAWNTNDIVLRHPNNREIYRFVGRSDDQIMLSTGQKTNPGPLERIIKQDPHVHDVIYFGRGRASNGILVQPKSFEEAEKLGIPDFRNLIWSSVEAANAYAPAHSRIFKEMILIAKSSKPFMYTAKETLSKGVSIDAYKEEIEALYKESASSVRAEVPIPLGTHPDGGWTEDESTKFVHQVVHLIMEDLSKNMGDDDDIFAFGCDSLRATYIRNTLINGLGQVAPPSNIEKLSTNFVYHSPSISQLSQILTATSRFESSPQSSQPESEEARKQRLETVITRYTQSWPTHKPEKETGEDEVILVTGTTGALGSQILVQLIDLPTVKRIYAVNHPTGQPIYERHVSTFNDRGLDLKLLESEKVVLVVGDVSFPGFGVNAQLYEEMRVFVTTIIHNAWRVNFKISLASYEAAIRGVRLLADFALSSPFRVPPKLLYTSSIGNIKPWVNLQPIPESPFLNIDQVNSMGYTESKWISERILTIAGDETALKPVIIRVGQMVGGVAGDWNATEWFPNLVGASQHIKGLPSCDGFASYLLLPTAASALLELRHASLRFGHLVDPKPARLNDLISIISENLGLPIIPYGDWLKRLEGFCQTNNDIMAGHLIDFYKASVRPEGVQLPSDNFEAMGLARFETTNTVEAAPSLKETPNLGRQEVERWLAYWRRKHLVS